MERLLAFVMRKLIQTGNLQVTTAGGSAFTLGDGTGPLAAIRFTGYATEYGILAYPDLKFGEAYMNGGMVVERGSIADVLSIILGQPHKVERVFWIRVIGCLRYIYRRVQQFNSRGRSKRNVAHHYDLDDRLYELFLDGDRQYSCAYFESPAQSLDEAQLAKKRHLAAKLLTQPSQRVLDIGCGWGGLSIYLSEICGTCVTGITLSERQLAIAQMRAADRILSRRTEFNLEDYRNLSVLFDRIVSVGMFEHVGVGFYDTFFRKCAALLKDDGVMVLSSIGRSEGPSVTNSWIAKYIFPGGYIPALSEVIPAVERAGLLITDIEILRLHYAETLRIWRQRFLINREKIERFYDARFVRMWDFYLVASEAAFRTHAMMVFQLQITKRQDVVPMTRDYIAQESARLRAIEQGRVPRLLLAGSKI
jgi:cyclopropane-fatty-acyl-phospholipid synthase